MTSTNPIPAKYLKRVRKICLALPEAAEKETWDHPTFRVRDKIFASMGTGDDGTTSMCMKTPIGEQKILLSAGHPFFYPKYVGSKGWIGVVLDGDTDWNEIEEMVADSYVAIAPKTLARRVVDGE